MASVSGSRTGHEQLHSAAPDAVLVAVDALRSRGERITAARRAVLEVLAGTAEHVRADDVVAQLEQAEPAVHRASVYRTLDLLTRLGIVTHVHAAGATVYHLAAAPAGHEHLHAHCRLCGDVVVVPADALDGAAAEVARHAGFRIEPGQSALVGVCGACDGT